MSDEKKVEGEVENVEEKAEQCEAAIQQAPEDDDGEAVTMLDVLAQENELEEDAKAVLGGSDENNCTYTDGYIPRQALYACFTCIPVTDEATTFKPAGVCLACSYNCHEGHDLVELYTKRNFRCDCGNSSFGDKKCSLEPEKDPLNTNNFYNQNFKGVYCTCHRPYPDPEDTVEDEMVQCIVCEDWYHGRHLDLGKSKDISTHNFSEMICGMCMEKNSFLWHYAKEYALNDETADVSIDVSIDEGIEAEASNNSKSEMNKSVAEECSSDHNLSKDQTNEVNLSASLATSSKSNSSCFLKGKELIAKKEATLWPNNWRSKLCQCESCKELYRQNGVVFLLDVKDTVQSYEEEGRQKTGASGTQYEQGLKALSSLDRIRQLDAIEEYNQMQVELKEFLADFAAKKRIVREEDIKGFFEELKARKRRRLEVGVEYVM